MSEHPNVTRIREGYAAFARGDLAALDDLLAEDIRWHVGGHSRLAGTYEGRPAVHAMFGKLMEITEGSFSVHLRAVFADDTDGVGVVTNSLRRGSAEAEIVQADLFRFVEGKVVEAWDASADQDAFDMVIG
jgi:ketosteroid isomerase-like protein